MKLQTSGEDYLEAILILKNKQRDVRAVDLAEHMGVSKPSVSRAVNLLREGGFLEIKGHRLEFTPAGLEVASQTYEKHCYFKQKLMQAGVEETIADKEACMLEHAVSEDTFSKLKRT